MYSKHDHYYLYNMLRIKRIIIYCCQTKLSAYIKTTNHVIIKTVYITSSI